MPLGKVKTEKKDMRRLSVYLEGRHYRFLDENSISKSDLVRKALDEFMDNHGAGGI